ncbi:hypothetical protein G7A66_02370 [Altererythrobacter sp. SALINAS58]|uniref:hypothetical protein n=1 Tax=Alteripontixanthobacter muriae TaxID=2705546 RepID=UPI0015774DBE|nr:hypothetical protein [Alteripontixanthobacter muriae]NTZ41955.1 hypothetical protein [Alteripontixanthobacter muriae]
MNSRKIFLSLAAGLSLPACSVADKELIGYQDPSFGDANRATYAAMVVDPAPAYAEPLPSTDAERAVRVTEAYREGTTEVPERVSTSETGTPN